MRVPVGGDLGQVRDAQHLELPSQGLQAASDDVGHRAADAGVDLVEDQCLTRRVRGGQRLQGQHEPRQFAPRGDPGQRSQVLSRIWRDVELPLLQATLRPLRLVAGVSKPDLALCAAHGQVSECGFQAAAKRRRRLPSRGGECDRGGREGIVCLRELRVELRGALGGILEVVELPAQALGGVGDVRQAGAVFFLEALQHRQPVLDLLEARRRGVDARRIGAQEVGEVLEL